MTLIDKIALRRTRENPNLLPAFWLMASYAYYIEDDPLLTDQVFDKLSRRLQRSFRVIRHRHKWLIDPHRTFTGYYLAAEDYPMIVTGALNELRRI